MGFSQAAGYVPTTIESIMLSVMENVNATFDTNYTEQTFLATNFYKYFYNLAQKYQENEIKTSEIFLSLQEYFTVTNERISRPVVTNPGILEVLATAAYVASIKKPVLADAGLAYICVDADDGDHARAEIVITSYANLVSGTDDSITLDGTVFTAQVGAVVAGAATFQAATSNAATAESLAAQINAHATASTKVKARACGAKVKLYALHGGTAANAYTLVYTDHDANVGATVSGATFADGTASASYDDTRLAICEIIKNSIAAGITTVGAEEETIVLTNGQSFDFKYNLPNKVLLLFRITTVLSDNNQLVIDSPEDQKAAFLANFAARYNLGKNFEPQRYFSVVDAPWAGDITLEWSDDDGTTWNESVIEAEFDELFVIELADVTLVES